VAAIACRLTSGRSWRCILRKERLCSVVTEMSVALVVIGRSPLIAAAPLVPHGACETHNRWTATHGVPTRWLLGSGIDPHPDVLDIHPRWRVGQYVSYFLERGDGSWTAFTIRIVNRPDDGAWVLIADFKTASGESTAWFGSNPQATAEVVDPVPLSSRWCAGHPHPHPRLSPMIREWHHRWR
jgi:hypothetical protein